MSSKVDLIIVIPTYNEAENIVSLIRSIQKHTSHISKIIIVDDNSPDGTSDIITNISKKNKNVYLLTRSFKKGRGSAVIEGFSFAKKFSPTYFLEMDADFSHKPKDISRLLRAIEEGPDVIIGSRYLKKSKILNWSLKRRMFSKLANIYARLILGVPIRDYTNGFRIYKKKAVYFLLSQKLKARGYILLSETAYLLKKAGFIFGEIPTTFVNRKRGTSNLNTEEVLDAFLSVWQIRLFS